MINKKRVAYASINMDNFSTIVGTGNLEICITQTSINIFKFLGNVTCDVCLQKHCQEAKNISIETRLLV